MSHSPLRHVAGLAAMVGTVVTVKYGSTEGFALASALSAALFVGGVAISIVYWRRNRRAKVRAYAPSGWLLGLGIFWILMSVFAGLLAVFNLF